MSSCSKVATDSEYSIQLHKQILLELSVVPRYPRWAIFRGLYAQKEAICRNPKMSAFETKVPSSVPAILLLCVGT